ncbi:hypothetical protein WAX74_15165 [Psychrobacillus sp. FJAT-51614]|uniref:Uncharacterized protein n=1 Tax=Psychrobacillus mangrovi TaxID=3117745 RepID=A0ABU8F7H2_9BACI
MSERFELNFKNKEVRIWFYLVIPTFIVGSIFILYGEQKYQSIPMLLLVIACTIFYTWRFYYRKKQKKEGKSSS